METKRLNDSNTGGSAAVVTDVQPTDLMAAIAQAVCDPRVDVEKMERLLAMHQTIVAEQRKVAYMAAMGRIAPKLPRINQHGRIEVNGQLRSKYARLEDIDLAIRPILAEEGFSMDFDSAPIEGGKILVTCRLSHCEGHSETKQIPLPIDKTGSKNDTQAVVSTVSYGRKALVKMFFNLVEGGEDNDGQGSDEPISKDQVLDIRTLLQDTKSDEKKFLELIAGVSRVEDIPARDYKRCINALETKMRTQK